ncbi:MAG: ATP-binding cassette domain-containing protein [Cytophagales bacterium]|nr:MAG: ATP-binding cassette domain-containing protein [Cytophagales bacterium]
MLEFKDVNYQIRQKTILKNINISIEKGNIYALLGTNGAGKTTLIKLIFGLLRPQSGKILFEGSSYVYNKIEVLRKIGSLIEHASLYGHLSAFENIEQARRIYGTEKSETYRLLEIVGLKDVMQQKTKRFSLGMKQRLGIALAMIGKPKLVVLDEPTNGLDPQGITELRNLILHLNQTEGTTFLIASHHLQEMEKIATNVIFIERGQIIHQEKLDKTLPINLEALYNQIIINL